MKNEIYKALLKRLLSSLVVLFLLVSFIFFLVRLAPGDPTQKYISPQLSPELAQQISESFNLNEPGYVQYFSFVKNIFTGDFGVSYNYRQPVLYVIKDYFLFTLLFSSISLIIQLMVSYLLVKLALRKAGGVLDKALSEYSLVLFATPSFVLGLILVYIFSVQLDLFPTSGIKSIYHDDLSFLGKLNDYFIHMILPLATLSLAGIAVFYRYLRDSMEDILSQSFITNLRSAGYTEKLIFNRHILPNAIRPLISVAGIEFGILLGGALITEVIFSLPGMGRLTVAAIFNRDFPLIIGCSFAAGLMMIVSNFIADLIKIKIDKRLVKDLIQ
jgi:peptide/nickel transport system permease protein